MRAYLSQCVGTLITALWMLGAAGAVAAAEPQPVRIKELGKLSGWRDNALVGYGLVTGLAGTGDSARNQATRQSLANMLGRFHLNLSSDEVQSRNTAAVMVTASLSSFAKAGDTLDVTVTSVGDARSLAGGLLVMAPLSGADGLVHAIAQGPVLVGGYHYDLNGNVVQKNHPTTGSVASGATVELPVDPGPLPAASRLSFVLADPDYTTAHRVALAIDREIGRDIAMARDAAAVEIRLSDAESRDLARFIARLEGVTVIPDVRARVVINERTGTVVAGGDVRISKVAISHGDLKVSVVTTNEVSQPLLVRDTGPGVRTEIASNSRITVEEGRESAFLSSASDSVSDLVQALSRLKTPTRDVISILRAIKAAGALHAELIVQ